MESSNVPLYTFKNLFTYEKIEDRPNGKYYINCIFIRDYITIKKGASFLQFPVSLFEIKEDY